MAKNKKPGGAETADGSKKKQLPQQKKRGFRVPLWFKFTTATVSLIALIFGGVGFILYQQQSSDLGNEVRERGRTIAGNLADNSREAILTNNELDLALLVRKAVQPDDAPVIPYRFDFKNPQHVFDGVVAAGQDLIMDAPKQLNDICRLLFNVEAGFAEAGRNRSRAVENEGVFEGYIVNKDGIIIAHSDFSRQGVAWYKPDYVQVATEKEPYPVYEQEYEDSNGDVQKRRLFDISLPINLDAESTIGTVHLGMSRDIIDQVVFESTMTVIALALAAIVLGLFFAFVIVNWMVSPVGRLLKGVLAIAGGNFDTRIKVGSRDELGALTLAFNSMAKSLSENETLKGAFSRYVSDAALDQLLSDPTKTGLHSRKVFACVYSSDVRGFTMMSETLEPEEVVDVINTYLSLQTDILLKHGGVVDKFIGDACIGVFGKEEQRADDTLRCVKAAIEIQKEISRINVIRKKEDNPGKPPKDIGIGINTGDIIAGNIGSTQKMEYTIAGNDAQLADHLCDDCPAGKIWMTQASYDLVKDDVLVKKVAPMKIKGEAEPVTVYEVVSLNEA